MPLNEYIVIELDDEKYIIYVLIFDNLYKIDLLDQQYPNIDNIDTSYSNYRLYNLIVYIPREFHADVDNDVGLIGLC